MEDPPQTEDAEDAELCRNLWVVDAHEDHGGGGWGWAPTGLYYGTWFEPDNLGMEIGQHGNAVLSVAGLRDVQQACDELGLRGVMNFYGPHDCGHLRSGQKFDPWFEYPSSGTADVWDAIACMLRDGAPAGVEHLVYDRALRLAAAAEARLQESIPRTMPTLNAIMEWTWSALLGDDVHLGDDALAIIRIVNHFKGLARPIEDELAHSSSASNPGSSAAHSHDHSGQAPAPSLARALTEVEQARGSTERGNTDSDGPGRSPAATLRARGLHPKYNHAWLYVGSANHRNMVRRLDGFDEDGEPLIELYEIMCPDTTQRDVYRCRHLALEYERNVILDPELRFMAGDDLQRRGEWFFMPGSGDVRPYSSDAYVCSISDPYSHSQFCLRQSSHAPCVRCFGSRGADHFLIARSHMEPV